MECKFVVGQVVAFTMDFKPLNVSKGDLFTVKNISSGRFNIPSRNEIVEAVGLITEPHPWQEEWIDSKHFEPVISNLQTVEALKSIKGGDKFTDTPADSIKSPSERVGA